MNDQLFRYYYESPIGWLEFTAMAAGLTAVNFVAQPPAGRSLSLPELAEGELAEGSNLASAGEPLVTLFQTAVAQFSAYFAGEPLPFTLPLVWAGTPFQHEVWQAVQAIPYGQTQTYGRLAAQLGRPAAGRAVGHANGQNPFTIIVPCHRLVGSDGRLRGYGGGLWRKAWLLAHEQKCLSAT